MQGPLHSLGAPVCPAVPGQSPADDVVSARYNCSLASQSGGAAIFSCKVDFDQSFARVTTFANLVDSLVDSLVPGLCLACISPAHGGNVRPLCLQTNKMRF